MSLEFVEASAEALPFDDSSFDAVTIAFGLRNVRCSRRRSAPRSHQHLFFTLHAGHAHVEGPGRVPARPEEGRPFHVSL